MATWRDRLADARKFWDLAEAASDPAYVNQAASNAVLAVIAANDAICLYFAGSAPRGDSHTQAARALREACKGRPCEREVADRSRQLLDILREKNAVQYHGRPLSAAAAEKLMRQAERFLEWAEDILPGSASRTRGSDASA